MPYDSTTGTQDRDASPRCGLRFSGGVKGASGCAGLGGDTAVGGAGALAAAAPAGCLRISGGISMLARVGSEARIGRVGLSLTPRGQHALDDELRGPDLDLGAATKDVGSSIRVPST